jgi:hypothetical protein
MPGFTKLFFFLFLPRAAFRQAIENKANKFGISVASFYLPVKILASLTYSGRRAR